MISWGSLGAGRFVFEGFEPIQGLVGEMSGCFLAGTSRHRLHHQTLFTRGAGHDMDGSRYSSPSRTFQSTHW